MNAPSAHLDVLPDHVDVLVIGAGLSGVGAAAHLRREHPRRSFVVLEAREAMGGTWDLFRYPGIRSDSDMFTLGYRSRPWTEAKAIADGTDILRYIRDTARDTGVDTHVRYRRRVTHLSWDSATARWTATVEHGGTGATETLTAGFVHSCTGYYRYDEGYRPTFPGEERFGGLTVHPQHWPEDLDATGKRFAVIGSGATAVTLVPSLAAQGAAHVTMVQRSPSYIASLPARDPIADVLRKVLPQQRAYGIVRWKNVAMSAAIFHLCQRFPAAMRRFLTWRVARSLPEDFDVDTHFQPAYDPWDQRLCLVPDDDLFRSLRREQASIVTGNIATFTATGIEIVDGTHVEADVIVTATGLNLLMLGGMSFEVDGEVVDPADTVAYKGMMLSGVPNLAFTVGYTNASWTLKADLVADYVSRLLRHLDDHDLDHVTPVAPGSDVPLRPLIDLTSGYVTRSLDQLPKQADRAPWRLFQNYVKDVRMFRRGALDDEGVRFGRASRREERAAA